jgi:putative DNA primase/helicase
MTYSESASKRAVDAALELAAAGFHVFPLHHILDGGSCSCRDGSECDGAGKHPRERGWQQQATTEADKVRALWAKYPLANVGIATGRARGCWVIGPDGEQGKKDLKGLADESGELPRTLTAETGSGGEHLFFRWPVGIHVANAKDHRGLKIDIRGEGGLVVGAGSRNRNGPYRWKERLSPVDVAVAEAPDWLVDWAGGELALDKEEEHNGEASSAGPFVEVTGSNVESRACAYLDRIPPAVSGQGGSPITLWAARVLVIGFDLPHDRAFALLRDRYNPRCEPPWSDKELWHKIDDATSKPFGKSRGWLLNGRSASRNGISDPVTEAAPAPEHLTDLGNARRVVTRHGHDLRYCHPWKSWIVWDGTRWAEDQTAEAVRRVKETQASLFRWAAEKIGQLGEVGGDDARKAQLAKLSGVLAHALRWESAVRITASLQLAQSEPAVPVLPTELDGHHFLLNCANGTLDLRTGRLRRHRREDLITKLCPVEYYSDAKCPLWDRFLERVMAGKQSLIDYLRRVIGYCLTGSVAEQALWFFHGAGANGKSTFLGTVLAMLGDYAMQAVSELLMVKNHEAHPTERADLFGKRFVATIETEEGKRMAESLMKQLTGGDKIRARKMRQDFFEFDPTHKILLAANHRPVIRGRDGAVWRRIKLVPFTVTIPDVEKDKDLAGKLRRELPGILAWAVRGCLEWQLDGLIEPPEVFEATKNYRADQDFIHNFLTECCIQSPHAQVRVSALHEAYISWSGDRNVSAREFNNRVRDAGYESERGCGGNYYWRGVGLPARADSEWVQ